MYKYAECRALMGHAWSRVGPLRASKQRGSYVFDLACDRCPTRKSLVINLKGAITSRKYYPPKDYRLTREASNPQDLRAALFNKWYTRTPKLKLVKGRKAS